MKKKINNSDSESSNSEEIDDSENSTDSEDKITIMEKFTPKEKCYYKMINDFFEDETRCTENDIEKMVLIIDGKSQISLRVLDWLVTKYSKVGINIKTIAGEKQNLRLCYKSTLKTYKKRYFDPFKRQNKRIKFWYFYTIKGEEFKIRTTLGQLNFFKWAIYNGVIKYVEENLGLLTREMKKSNKEDKKRKEDNDSSSGTLDSKSRKSLENKIYKKALTSKSLSSKNGKLEISFD
jgi:hypothetical protein